MSSSPGFKQVSSPNQGATARVGDPGNVLVVLFDDLGADKIGLYGLGAEVASTPTIDALAADGVRFSHAYAHPLCSPTRAAILTGRQSYRTGVGYGVDFGDDYVFPESETTLAEMLGSGTGGTHDASYIGKWHLGTEQSGWIDHPNVSGFPWYSGAMTGVAGASHTTDGLLQRPTDWERVENGQAARTTVYMETSHIDDAISRAQDMPEPWLLIVALANAHEPIHQPPADLYDGPGVGSTKRKRRFHWMVEAADTEVGRLLDALGTDVLDRTTVIVTGDNGTKGDVMSPELDTTHSKGTLYEGGVHVPLIVSGPTVVSPGRVVDSLVHMVDVFPTVAELTGTALDPNLELDGVSFAPLLADPVSAPTRTIVYSELFEPVGFGPRDYHDQMVRDEDWKLVRVGGADELYDMRGREHEAGDLLAGGALTAEQQAAYDRLLAALPTGPNLP